jgi:hypothetical protein
MLSTGVATAGVARGCIERKWRRTGGFDAQSGGDEVPSGAAIDASVDAVVVAGDA